MTFDFHSLSTVSQCLELRDQLTQSGEFLELKNQLSLADPTSKKQLGAQLNLLRQSIYEACNERIKEIQQEQEKDNFKEFDPTFFVTQQPVEKGQLHPITQVTKEVVGIFQRMGFDVFEGNQVETQHFNFTTVGTPAHHPARGMQDTFWLEQQDQHGENYVMRTQMTANIGRYLQNHQPPIRAVFAGLTFRAEDIDATHDINFHQMDLWIIDKDTTAAQLVTIITEFLKEFFEDPALQYRVRPSYFPFVQPTFEIDIFLPWFKGGQWVEVVGAGPIRSSVLESCGVDSRTWSGIACGFGLTRLAQLKLKVSGLAQFYNGGLDFLKGSI